MPGTRLVIQSWFLVWLPYHESAAFPGALVLIKRKHSDTAITLARYITLWAINVRYSHRV